MIYITRNLKVMIKKERLKSIIDLQPFFIWDNLYLLITVYLNIFFSNFSPRFNFLTNI